MNDFTKEELIEILDGLDEFYLYHSPYKIGNKIRSMIDNYCEHEYALAFVDNGTSIRCLKCKREL